MEREQTPPLASGENDPQAQAFKKTVETGDLLDRLMAAKRKLDAAIEMSAGTRVRRVTRVAVDVCALLLVLVVCGGLLWGFVRIAVSILELVS